MNIGKSNLDCMYFETLAQEALRLLRIRPFRNANGHGPMIHAQAKDLKEVTTAAVIDRLSTSQQ